MFLMIGVLPLLMGITMWIQMRLNPAPPDPVQAQIFNWMPIFFTFLLASFPAGLVLYWAWNNFLSIIQQANDHEKARCRDKPDAEHQGRTAVSVQEKVGRVSGTDA